MRASVNVRRTGPPPDLVASKIGLLCPMVVKILPQL